MNNYSLPHSTPWSPSPYINFSLANTSSKSFGKVDDIRWWDQIDVDASITMGKYHGNDPLYPDFHGSDYVHKFYL